MSKKLPQIINLAHFKGVVFVALETTCFPLLRRPPSFHSEVIEISAVKIPHTTIVDTFSTFVRPKNFPILSPYCTSLTTITQEQVDNAPPFKEAFKSFVAWTEDFLPCSWGYYARNLFRKSCAGIVPFPFRAWVNLKSLYAQKTVQEKHSLSVALKELKLAYQGTPHRADCVVQNVFKLIERLFEEDLRSISRPSLLDLISQYPFAWSPK